MLVWTTLAALGGIVVAGVALWRVPWWIDAHYIDGPGLTQPVATTVTGIRTALLAVGAGGLAAIGITYTHRTLHQTREGQVTDRYTKAIGQIASERPVEQLGGIYALERIMRDSEKDHATIVEVLAAFVREHAPAPTDSVTEGEERLVRRSLRMLLAHLGTGGSKVQVRRSHIDRPSEPVQAALTVLGRRPRGRDEPFHIDLSKTYLRGANLARAHLEKALLWGAHLEYADLTDARLEGAELEDARLYAADLTDAFLMGAYLGGAYLVGAHLMGTHLEGADLNGAHLENAFLRGAQLQKTDLGGANLQGANVRDAILEGASMDGADLEGAAELTVKQVVGAHPDKTTRLPESLAKDPLVKARIADFKYLPGSGK
ncbi:pentapeptide repeat-containing protein [Streptomyces sp. D2-8]|nr:pentapeptide repeat-containing protein [Streptomyces sp. D2-8]